MPEQQISEKQTFDYQAFARQLATEAESLVPEDISPENKAYVANIVFNFCNLACDSILKEEAFTLDEATMITQFIGEWTFHKSIDLIRAGIQGQYRDSVLQKIAFVVFEMAKNTVAQKMPQPEIVIILEQHVNKAYGEALTEMLERNLITQQDYDSAMSQSNIDQMSNSEDAQQDAAASFSDIKVLKLATFAMILQKMPKEKVDSILKRFSPEEASVLKDYISMDGLEAKIDSSITKKYISELKSSIPKPEKLDGNKIQNKLRKIVTKQNSAKINDIILDERQGIKQYISDITERKDSYLPSALTNILYTHIAEKLEK